MDEYINKKEIIRHLCLTTGCSYHDVVIRTIMDFPATDVQPVRHGLWVEYCNELDKKCSCCDKVHGTIYEREPFCPNCGARMDGDNNA